MYFLVAQSESTNNIHWKAIQPKTGDIYIDTTLQFTPSQCSIENVDPTKDKLALWLDVYSDDTGEHTNLCIYAAQAILTTVTSKSRGIIIGGGLQAAPTTKPRVFRLRGTESITPNNWYRLTIKTLSDVTWRTRRTGLKMYSLLGFQIFLDDKLLFADESAFTKPYLTYAISKEGWLDAKNDKNLLDFLQSGSVFISLCGEGENNTIGSVGFQGDANIREVDVTDQAPLFLGVDSLDWTLSLTPEESVISAIVQ